MLTFEQATWIPLDEIGLGCGLIEDMTLEKPYGWYFMYQSRLRRLVESINHGLGKPDYELTLLLPVLIDGHNHLTTGSAQRIKSTIRGLTAEELTWLADNIDVLLPDK